jgi:hypothetical protein
MTDVVLAYAVFLTGEGLRAASDVLCKLIGLGVKEPPDNPGCNAFDKRFPLLGEANPNVGWMLNACESRSCRTVKVLLEVSGVG